MIELGHYALILALGLAIAQFAAPLLGAHMRDPILMNAARPIAFMQFLLVGLAYAALTNAYLTSDFSVINVIENSHSAKPLIYKISGVWGNHEGSILFWTLILSLCGAAIAALGSNLPADLRARVLSIQGLMCAAFLLFILLTSNPFARLEPPRWEGFGLNPVLQDPGLAIHPPLLYLGYVGFSISFAFAAAALIGGRVDAAWARLARPWTLAAWIFLTLGIAMGSYWAYYTLGWGGFWFWDPVENASLLPWLAGTALLHSTIVTEKRDALKVWTVFLSVLTFSLSLIGTFLVRSGVLTSVHSFASNPTRGMFILIILAVFIGGAFILFAIRAPQLKTGGLFAPISREGALVVNNLLLTSCCATIFIGTLYPVVCEIFEKKITVGAGFYNFILPFFVIPLFLITPLGPLLPWKRGDLLAAAQRLIFALGLGIAASAAAAAYYGQPIGSIIFFGLGVFLAVGAFAEILMRAAPRWSGLGSFFARLKGLPSSTWGAATAHAGVGIVCIGVSAVGWGNETIATLKQGETYSVGPYQIALQSVAPRQGPNYREIVMTMAVSRDGAPVVTLTPSKRYFTTQSMPRTEAGIATLGLGQIYVSFGEQHSDGSVDGRLYWKPLVTLIWIGGVVMALGGCLSLFDRRLRIGVARRASKISKKLQGQAAV